MKRILLLCLLSVGLSTLCPVAAQESPTARAEREQAEERYHSTIARMRNLEETLESYQKRLSRQEQEMHTLREEVSRVSNSTKNAVTRDELNRLAESVKEVDRKRVEDNRKVLTEMSDTLNNIKRLISERPAPAARDREPVSNPGPTPPAPKLNPDQPGYEYTIRQGDTLSGIVLALKKQAPPIKVTQQQLIEANPTVKWNRLLPGRKIFIPAPMSP